MRWCWVYTRTLRSDLVFDAREHTADSVAASNLKHKLRHDSRTSLLKG